MLQSRISRRQFLILQTATAITCGLGLKSCSVKANPSDRLSALSQVGDEFTFALIADPQLRESTTTMPVEHTAQLKLSQTIEELNQMTPKLPFVIFNGDLVGRVNKDQVKNFLDRVQPLASPAILIHGNHDGGYPFKEFKRMQNICNGTEGVEFSFDCGKWHFVTIPSNLEKEDAYLQQVMTWLDRDLAANRNKPTMAFIHYHLLPQGLTPLAWYTYSKTFRQQLINQLAKYGNVRYVIAGHVHNGIQASVKTAWTYQGIHFITAPTCTASRNFGEEYPQFQAGMPKDEDNVGGGYYLLIDIKGETAQVRGRLVGTKEEFIYPQQFKPYEDEDPLWFNNVTNTPLNLSLVNASFDQGLQGWVKPYRYIADTDPGFITKTVTDPALDGGQAAYVFCREKGRTWSRDEAMELYQVVSLPKGGSPVLSVHYYPEAALKYGGGYILVSGHQGNDLKVLMLLDWNDGYKKQTSNFNKHVLFTMQGRRSASLSLQKLGRKQQALFAELPAEPGRWHQVQLALDTFYDRAVQRQGAFAALGVDKVLIRLGVWCLADKGARSGAYFDNLGFEARPDVQEALVINGQALETIGSQVFKTDFTKTKT